MADRAIGRRPRSRHASRSRLAAAVALLALVGAACGSNAASPSSPSSTATPLLTAEPTPEVTPSPLATATPEAQPSQVAVGECTPGPPSSMSLDWVDQVSKSGLYHFARPADWADLSNDATIPANSSVSPETFAETGLADDATQQVDLVRAFDGSVGVSAWAMEGVTTRTDTLFQRELAWLQTQPQLTTVLDEELEWCIGGSRARGFSSTWSFPSGDMHIVIFIVQRGSKMYEVQLTTTDPAKVDIFHELLNRWEFTEPIGPGDDFAATDFKVAGMAATLDDTGDSPNQADFQAVFPAQSAKIYVIYELDDGAHDTVQFSWKQGAREIVANQFDYKETTTFAWGWITPPSSGKFATGSYTVTLTLANSGDTITLPFTVE